MTKRNQERLFLAAQRLVYAIRYGDPKTNVKCGVDDEIYIAKRTAQLEKVLKEITKR